VNQYKNHCALLSFLLIALIFEQIYLLVLLIFKIDKPFTNTHKIELSLSKYFQINNLFEIRSLNSERNFFHNCMHFRSKLRTILHSELSHFELILETCLFSTHPSCGIFVTSLYLPLNQFSKLIFGVEDKTLTSKRMKE